MVECFCRPRVLLDPAVPFLPLPPSSLPQKALPAKVPLFLSGPRDIPGTLLYPSHELLVDESPLTELLSALVRLPMGN